MKKRWSWWVALAVLAIVPLGLAWEIRDQASWQPRTLNTAHHGLSTEVHSVAWSPDGTRLALQVRWNGGDTFGSEAQVWNVGDGTLSHRENQRDTASVEFSLSGDLIQKKMSTHEFFLAREVPARASNETPTAVASLTATAEPDPHQQMGPRVVVLRDARNGSKLRELKGHTATVTSLAFSPDGATLASASNDGTVKLWRVR